MPDLMRIIEEIGSEKAERDEQYFNEIKAATPARVDIGRAGARYKTKSMLTFLADQAAAADAVFSQVSNETVERLGLFEVQTLCRDKQEMIKRPDLGRVFSKETREIISDRCEHDVDVEIYVGDGLSAPSVAANAPYILSAVTDELKNKGYSVGTPFFVRYCRVNTVRTVAELLKSKVTCVLIGERPGLVTDESMSAYIAYNAGYNMSESDYTVVSNINRKGMLPVEAADRIVNIIEQMFIQKTSGVKLNLSDI